MSENAAVIERAYAAWDRAGLDAFLEHWTADARWHGMEGAPDDPGPMEGRDAIRAYLQDWAEIFAEFRVEPLELIDVGAKQVVATLRISGIVRHGGVKVPASYLGATFNIRDGRIAAGGEYKNLDQALEAAGLRE